MKLFLKRILPVLLAMLMLLSVVGCTPTEKDPADSDGSDSGSDTTESESESTDAGSFLEIIRDGKTEFVIVYPEFATAEELEAAQNVRDSIEKYVGVKLKMNDDFTSHSIKEKTYEILVGATNRTETQQTLEPLLFGQYTIQAVGTKLVICGTDGKATSNAASWFERQILKKKMQAEGADPDTFLFMESDAFTNEIDYMVESLLIGGQPLKNYRIVIPANASVEHYIAKLIANYFGVYMGIRLPIVTDAEPAQDCEILLGNTSRTTITAAKGEYRIELKGTKLQAVSSTLLGLPEIYWAFAETVFPTTSATIKLEAGAVFTGKDNSPTDLQKTGDMRILYHNVVGYSTDKCPVYDRADMMLAVYQTYLPEMICWQEASAKHRNDAESAALMAWLKENYAEICYKTQGGLGNPIFYRKDAGLELLDSGYSKARNGDKGSTWAVFKRADGTIFGVTNSHFAANTNAPNHDPEIGDQYRTQDADNLVAAIAGIRETYGSITIISGGDYNSTPSKTAYFRLTGAGLKSVRNLAATHTPFSAHHAYPTYEPISKLYNLVYSLIGNAAGAIDHIMQSGEAVTIHSYTILSDPFSLTTSDHAPHYVDFSFN